MPEASDKGSQPYSRAVRYGEMAGEKGNRTRNLADMQGTTSNLCRLPQGQAIKIITTLSQPFRNTKRRFCMAGYHCLMPIGISFYGVDIIDLIKQLKLHQRIS